MPHSEKTKWEMEVRQTYRDSIHNKGAPAGTGSWAADCMNTQHYIWFSQQRRVRCLNSTQEYWSSDRWVDIHGSLHIEALRWRGLVNIHVSVPSWHSYHLFLQNDNFHHHHHHSYHHHHCHNSHLHIISPIIIITTTTPSPSWPLQLPSLSSFFLITTTPSTWSSSQTSLHHHLHHILHHYHHHSNTDRHHPHHNLCFFYHHYHDVYLDHLVRHYNPIIITTIFIFFTVTITNPSSTALPPHQYNSHLHPPHRIHPYHHPHNLHLFHHHHHLYLLLNHHHKPLYYGLLTINWMLFYIHYNSISFHPQNISCHGKYCFSHGSKVEEQALICR